MSAFERSDVQGLVVSGYGHMHCARFLLLGIGDPPAARRWVGELADRVTASRGREGQRCVNIGLTAGGLARLGVRDDDLTTFPVPFREGMAAPHRQRILGDTDASDPRCWSWGGPDQEPVHVLLLLYARDEARFDELVSEETERFGVGGALRVLEELTPEPLPGRTVVGGKFGVEHFGFADGMSQPVIKGSGQEDRLTGDDARRAVIETGEFVLGYPNGYGEMTPWPRVTTAAGDGGDFGRNGTYLVVRQLAQDVAGFWRFLDGATKDADGRSDPEECVRLGAKFVGRWPSGAPLVESPHRDDPDLGADNSFGYAEVDPYGERCPIASHIRRSNPRDSLDDDPPTALERANLHRLMRRGRVYGPELKDPLGGDDGEERGLFFMCVNANIERQFEFVQHTWCNNPKFAGRYDEPDPVLSAQPEGGGRFTIQDRPVRRRVRGIPTFVTVRGGGYFFLPGIRALRHLGTLAG